MPGGKCRPCSNENSATWALAHKEKVAAIQAVYYSTHKERAAAYYVANKEDILTKKAVSRSDKKAQGLCVQCSKPAKLGRTLCKEHIVDAIASTTKRRQNNLSIRLASNLRSRLHHAIRGNFKAGSAVKDLGCTIEELKAYLEAKFEPGMDWDNWGRYGWHIDHIQPLASFDLTDREQFLVAFHYTNLQPLWASDNIRKGARK